MKGARPEFLQWAGSAFKRMIHVGNWVRAVSAEGED